MVPYVDRITNPMRISSPYFHGYVNVSFSNHFYTSSHNYSQRRTIGLFEIKTNNLSLASCISQYKFWLLRQKISKKKVRISDFWVSLKERTWIGTVFRRTSVQVSRSLYLYKDKKVDFVTGLDALEIVMLIVNE